MAGIDGALDFIPVMAFYWFVYAVYLYGWPGDKPLVLPEAEGLPGRLDHWLADLKRRFKIRRLSSSLSRAS